MGVILSLSVPQINASSPSLAFSAHDRKDQKKVSKLEAQISYHEGRGDMDEATKIKEQIAEIWEKAKQAALG